MQDLAGKTAVVTGAASGIGRALAERFAAEQMRLVLADIETEPLAEVEQALAATGVDVVSRRVDVSSYDDLVALESAAVEAFGVVHVLCNNAGVGGSTGLSWEIDLDDWAWTLDVDLWSVIHGHKAFLPGMIAHGEPAHVVNTASLAGHLANPFMGPYTAAKFGVVALSEVLHHELSMVAPQVRVSVLCPGFVRTRIHESDRNRPGGRGSVPEGANEIVRALVEAGTEPAGVADDVLEAIVAERFWVLPHPDALPALDKRLRGIHDGTDPTSIFASPTARD